MNKKTVELSSKRKVDIKEMLQDEVDFCQDLIIRKFNDQGMPIGITGLAKFQTALIRRGLIGGDFDNFEIGIDGFPTDSVIKQLNEKERDELSSIIREYQYLGE